MKPEAGHEIKLLSYDDEVKPKRWKAAPITVKETSKQSEDDDGRVSQSESEDEQDDRKSSSSISSASENSGLKDHAEDVDHEDDNNTDGERENKATERPARIKRTAEERLLKRLRNGVHRQAKLSKKFEIRRIIRMLEKARGAKNASNRTLRLEERLNKLKTLELNEIEELAIALGQFSETDEEKPSSKDDASNSGQDETDDDEAKSIGPAKEESKTSTPVPNSRFSPEEAKLRFEADVDLKNILTFKGLQLSVRELLDRPKREARRRLREKKRRAEEALAEQKRLERLKNPLVCMIKMCTARFAAEDAREKHRIKRHNTTGDWEKDIALGLRKSRPNSRERKALQLLKKGGPIEEIDRLMRPMTFAERKARKRELTSDEDDSEREHSNVEKSKNLKTTERQGIGKRTFRQDTKPFTQITNEAKRPRLQADTSKSSNSSLKGENNSRDRMQEKLPAKLHPSWEAKKKQQQSQIADFQGTKVEFSDDDD